MSKPFYLKHKGLVALEFTSLIPAYLAIIFGIVQLSLYFYTQQALTIAAFQSARYLAINQLESCSDLSDLVRTKIVDVYLRGYAINPEKVDIGVTTNTSNHCNCVGTPIVVTLTSTDALMGINQFKPFAVSVFRKEGVIGSEC